MHIYKALVLGGFAATLASGSALAGGGGCYGSSCYQKVVAPPTYSTYAEQVMVSPGGVRRHVAPAEYGAVAETVVVQPERTIARHIPAVTSTVADRVMVSPGGKRWQVTRDAYGREIGCWVYDKPTYAVQHRTVVVRPSSVAYDSIPAVTATRHRTVMTRPAQVYEEAIPASYATRHRTVMTSPGGAYWSPLR